MKNVMFRVIAVWIAAMLSGAVNQLSVAQQEEKAVQEDFMVAVVKGDVSRVSAMLKANPKLAEARDERGISAIMNAVYYRNKDVVDMLLATGIQLSVFEASATGQVERVRALILQDPSLVNSYSPDGFAPLGLAVFFGHPETVEVLLEAGADANAPSRETMRVSPLHSAAAARQAGIARTLLAHGAQVNITQTGSGFTPLHEAAANGDMEFAKVLIENGADVNAKMKDGKTPLAMALKGGHSKMSALLRDHGAVQ